MMALEIARRLWKLPAIKGLVLSVGVLIAIATHGHLKYRDGFAAGVTKERTVAAADLAVAQQSAIASQVAAESATAALRDTIGTLRGRVAVLSEEAALARGNYRAALRAYEQSKLYAGDSGHVSPVTEACDELARACAVAIAAAQAERDTLSLSLAAAERLVAVRDSSARLEGARTSLALRESLAAQRAAFKGPSRVVWGVSGTILGAAVAWLVRR
jgi:hypothetical protein